MCREKERKTRGKAQHCKLPKRTRGINSSLPPPKKRTLTVPLISIVFGPKAPLKTGDQLRPSRDQEWPPHAPPAAQRAWPELALVSM